MEGWIKLHRDIQGTWIHKDPILFKAYIDILFNVNWEEKKVFIGGTQYTCGVGESLNSLDTWAEILGKDWNKSKVRRIFKRLTDATIIDTQNERKTTRLRVVNMGCSDILRHEDETQNDTKMKRKTTPTKEERNKEYITIEQARNIIFDMFDSEENCAKNIAIQYKLETGQTIEELPIQIAVASFLQKGMTEYYKNLTRPDQVISKLMQWITNGRRNESHQSKSKKKDAPLDYEKYIIDCWYKEEGDAKNKIEVARRKGFFEDSVKDFNSRIEELKGIHKKHYSQYPNLSIYTIFDVLYSPLAKRMGDTKERRLNKLKQFIESLTDYQQNKSNIRVELVKSKNRQMS